MGSVPWRAMFERERVSGLVVPVSKTVSMAHPDKLLRSVVCVELGVAVGFVRAERDEG